MPSRLSCLGVVTNILELLRLFEVIQNILITGGSEVSLQTCKNKLELAFGISGLSLARYKLLTPFSIVGIFSSIALDFCVELCLLFVCLLRSFCVIF